MSVVGLEEQGMTIQYDFYSFIVSGEMWKYEPANGDKNMSKGRLITGFSKVWNYNMASVSFPWLQFPFGPN